MLLAWNWHPNDGWMQSFATWVVFAATIIAVISGAVPMWLLPGEARRLPKEEVGRRRSGDWITALLGLLFGSAAFVVLGSGL